MKKAYSLIELIFVIVIIGVLAGVASSSFKSDYLSTDANYIVAKIKEAQYRGVGYEHRTFGGGVDGSNVGCITLTKAALESKAVNAKIAYKLHVDLLGDLSNKTVCFDAKGEAHDDGLFNSSPIGVQKVLGLRYNGEDINITILHKTGFTVTSCKF